MIPKLETNLLAPIQIDFIILIVRSFRAMSQRILLKLCRLGLISEKFEFKFIIISIYSHRVSPLQLLAPL